MKLKPNLDMLPEAQKELWPLLKDTPKDFVLYGGTAVALRYGHRQSIDFDFFTTTKMNLQETADKISYLSKTHDYNFYSSGQLDLILAMESGMVKVTFLNNPDIILGEIKAPCTTIDNKIKIASPIDLMACKILALHHRTEVKDFIDLGELIKNNVSLQKGFEAAYALTKISQKGSKQITLDRLKEDLKAKTLSRNLPDNPEYVDLIRSSANDINLDKVLKTRLKARPKLSIGKEISR